MRLPTWIPETSRPWNPAYAEVWDLMSPNERRQSWLIDCLMIFFAVATITLLYRVGD